MPKPKAPYLILAFDVDPNDPEATEIIADVTTGFPASNKPVPFDVDHVFFIPVPPSKPMDRFMDVGMYLTLKDQEHGGALRWVLQLCRIDEFAGG